MYRAGVCDPPVLLRNGCITSWKGACVREPCNWRLWKQAGFKYSDSTPHSVCEAAIAYLVRRSEWPRGPIQGHPGCLGSRSHQLVKCELQS